MRKRMLAAVAVLAAGSALSFAGASAQGVGNFGPLGKVDTYEHNLNAYAAACNRAAFDHDLMNLRALAQILDQQLQNTNASTAQGLKAKGLSDDQALRQMDRDRNNPLSPLHDAYTGATVAHQVINHASGIWADLCRPPVPTANGPPTRPPGRPGGVLLPPPG